MSTQQPSPSYPQLPSPSLNCYAKIPGFKAPYPPGLSFPLHVVSPPDPTDFNRSLKKRDMWPSNSSPSVNIGAPYISMSDCLAWARIVKPDLDAIPPMMFATAGEIIENRTKKWGITAQDQFVNGDRKAYIFCPVTPIVVLSDVVLIASDLGEEHLVTDPTNPGRQVWYDPLSGLIRRISFETENMYTDQNSDLVPYPLVYPEGLQNIKISGIFGSGPLATLGTLQALITFKMMGFLWDDFDISNLFSEKIGEYQQTFYDMQRAGNEKNEKQTLEGYIEYLFISLPKDDYTSMVLAI